MKDWLKNAIANYDNLSDNDKAHVDATLDNISDNDNFNDVCICGTKDCPDAYSHVTGGW